MNKEENDIFEEDILSSEEVTELLQETDGDTEISEDTELHDENYELFSQVRDELKTEKIAAKEEKKTKAGRKKKKEQENEEFSLKAEIISWVKLIVIAFLIAVFIDRVIIVNATVPTGSMENTIMTGSRMIGLRFSYWFSEPERGDVVVFKYPLDEKQNYVKRVIGLPGEVVVINDSKVYVYKDGDKSKEPVVLEEDYLKEEWISRCDGYEFTIPDECYLMMGDNRNNSADARVWQESVAMHNRLYPDDLMDENIIYVKKDKILGKAVCTYWPLNNIGIIK